MHVFTKLATPASDFIFSSVHSVIYAVHHIFNQNILYLPTNEVGIKRCFQVV